MGRGSLGEERREPAAATAGGESGRARESILPPLLFFRSSLTASALVSPPSEVLTSVAFRRCRERRLLEVKTTSGVSTPTKGEFLVRGEMPAGRPMVDNHPCGHLGAESDHGVSIQNEEFAFRQISRGYSSHMALQRKATAKSLLPHQII